MFLQTDIYRDTYFTIEIRTLMKISQLIVFNLACTYGYIDYGEHLFCSRKSCVELKISHRKICVHFMMSKITVRELLLWTGRAFVE